MQKERKHLDISSLLSSIKTEFKKISDPNPNTSKYPIADCLMSAGAIFGLKYASLLQMTTDLQSNAPLNINVKNLYQVTEIPSDTHLRARLDNIEPKKLQPALDVLIKPLQRGKILPNYLYFDEYYLVSIDGTGYFSSDKISCENCCIKQSRPTCKISIIYADSEVGYQCSLVKWKIANKQKDSILLLYSIKDAQWYMHTYDMHKGEAESQVPIPRMIATELQELLSEIKNTEIDKNIIESINNLLMEDYTLFDGREKSGKQSYYHQALSAVLVHPDKKNVFPLAVEPIIKQDGTTKNDCERNAAFRILKTLKASHPHLKFIILLDALYANGPLISLLKELNFKFIITAKNTDYLLEEYHNNGQKQKFEKIEEGIERRYGFSSGLPLNQANATMLVNFLEYSELKKSYSKKYDKVLEARYYSSWITDLPVTKHNMYKLMRGGRARWKIENEVHNTLKNQGYNFEHNYGHGDNNLSTVFCYMMFIMFTIDQIQEYCGYYFGQILILVKQRINMWRYIFHRFVGSELKSWEDMYINLLNEIKSVRNTT